MVVITTNSLLWGTFGSIEPAWVLIDTLATCCPTQNVFIDLSLMILFVFRTLWYKYPVIIQNSYFLLLLWGTALCCNMSHWRSVHFVLWKHNFCLLFFCHHRYFLFIFFFHFFFDGRLDNSRSFWTVCVPRNEYMIARRCTVENCHKTRSAGE